MATSASSLSLFLLSLSLLSLTATARPCKTLFFYTTTTSYYPSTTTTAASFRQNPNFEILPKFHSYSPKFLTFFFTTVNSREETRPYVSYLSLRRTRANPFPLYFEEVPAAEEEKQQRSSVESSVMPLGIYSSVSTSSIRDRTKDIMSVVGALLFGVGCGALTAATMFLIWSLFSPHRFDFDDSDDDDDGYDNGDDVASPKKIGYIAIPGDVDLVKNKDFNSVPQKEVA
ncbi:unnamed protein product [Coffea canephora]|uniref:Uncharacterized protein n=1 Tax=Coffea canephora TaxID=49390 RepID=A0A068TZS5_COFCA|nr:uncharacterized protein LOC113699486 [Coffea arabica]CDP01731.1 unnamed protein product [Coffea canephora]